jgi:hypothetical protein
MSVVFINLFEVPAGRDETFRALWQQVNDYMRTPFLPQPPARD